MACDPHSIISLNTKYAFNGDLKSLFRKIYGHCYDKLNLTLMGIRYRLIFLIAFILLLKISAIAQYEDELNLLDSYYQNALDAWKVPGMAVAIIKDDSIIFEKGYGYSSLSTKNRRLSNIFWWMITSPLAWVATTRIILSRSGVRPGHGASASVIIDPSIKVSIS